MIQENREMVVVGFSGCLAVFWRGGFFPKILPVSVDGIFRGQEVEFYLCSGVVCGIVAYL